jgi:hypothetical protein
MAKGMNYTPDSKGVVQNRLEVQWKIEGGRDEDNTMKKCCQQCDIVRQAAE